MMETIERKLDDRRREIERGTRDQKVEAFVQEPTTTKVLTRYHLSPCRRFQCLEDFDFPPATRPYRKRAAHRVPGNNREFVYDLSFCTQSGTHIQGPHYFLEYGKTIDLFPIETFEGPCLIIDLKKRGTDTTEEDLKALIRAEERALPILILRTGT